MELKEPFPRTNSPRPGSPEQNKHEMQHQSDVRMMKLGIKVVDVVLSDPEVLPVETRELEWQLASA